MSLVFASLLASLLASSASASCCPSDCTKTQPHFGAATLSPVTVSRSPFLNHGAPLR